MPAIRPTAKDRFTAALDALIARVQEDRSILGAILCGSLSHDTVWEKSDVDLILVTIDDRKVPESHIALYADGVNVHALLVPRAELRKLAEGSLQNSFLHAFVAKGRILYAHDETIHDLWRGLRDLGERDTEVQLLRAATFALPPIYKAHKWFITRGDLEYTALWILWAATGLARIEVIGARQIADREVIPQAMQLNPDFFRVIYTDLLNRKKTRVHVQRALDAMDRYIVERTPRVFARVFAYLEEAGEARSCTEIEDWFRKHLDVEGVTTACEYLADQGLIGKASVAVRLTKKSNVDVQELAFFHLGPR
jgi:predicted nucleotidyltransferase